jgi:hypothetical protein
MRGPAFGSLARADDDRAGADQGGTVALGDKGRERRQAADLAAWQADRDRVQAFLARAETFAGATNAEVPTLPLQLLEDERALLVLPGVHLVELRRLPGHFMGGNGGFTFHVARAHRGSPAGADHEPTPIDTGVVMVTDRRTVFSGSLHTRTWDYTTVIGFHTNDDPPWTAVAVSDRQRVSGIRYDATQAEEFRFALALGLARCHRSEASLIDDLRRQLDEIDRQRPGGSPLPDAAASPVPASMPSALPDMAGASTLAPYASPTSPPTLAMTPTTPAALTVPGSPVVAATPTPLGTPTGLGTPVPGATPTGAGAPTAVGASASAATPPSSPPPGWYPDPYRTARLRWWDGHAWTAHAAP